ncbi:Na-translocating system protein MpsC family protein [Effusibacillus consociatus]|uniref:Na-translocating system protein MpsC family protein n=1 Tax=Effusibacillus consociatus TaxID=1117041 RepID=A0ABV9PZ49_9BACL
MLSAVHSPVTTFKKQLAHLFNQINQEMYGVGVKKQRIEIFDDKIIIFSQSKRVPALASISEKYPELTVTVDAALVGEYKARLKEQFQNMFSINVVAILKDYDPNTESACTVICLEEPFHTTTI